METVKKMVGLSDDNDKCEEKVQEKLAGKLYEKLWPILSDRLCNKFEENAENMATRITDYIVHQLEEKTDYILPIVKKMLDIMNPITNNTEDERKSLVDLLEKITNRFNEIRNLQEMAKSNAPPQKKEEEVPFSETVKKDETVATNEAQVTANPIVATNEPVVAPTVEAPTNVSNPIVATNEAPTVEAPTVAPTAVAPANLAALTSKLPGSLASMGTSALGKAATLTDKLPGPLASIGTAALRKASTMDFNDKLPINPNMLSAKIPTMPTVPTLPSAPNNASGFMNMASKGLAALPKKGGSRKMMRTYKNRLINKLYKQTPLSGKTKKRNTRKA